MSAQARPQVGTAPTADNDPRWQTLVARDRSANGTFLYSVATTGVYCRPSCAARLPNPKNVQFHGSCAAAERAGFRACKRCKPDQASLELRNATKVAEACQLLTRSETPPALAQLAQHVGLSPHHFHRIFKASTGVTPRAYAAACRDQRLRAALASQSSVTRAMYEAGFGSSGQFYEQAQDVLGMTPGAYRAGGTRTRIRFAVGQSTLGAILVACTEKGVCAIVLGDQPEPLLHDLQERFPRAELLGADPQFEHLVARVVAMVEQPRLGLDLPLDIRGTAFQQRVWQALREIPAGSTASYGEIAARIGSPAAVRAVGSACGANALAVAIPCHRVVRSDGGLSGYRWGIERKQALLQREARS